MNRSIPEPDRTEVTDRAVTRRVLFVCTGNTCRSPLAEAVARARGIAASSAGTDAIDGVPASRDARAAAADVGLNVSGHLSRAVSDADMADADFVFTMTSAQADVVRARWPRHAHKVARLDPDGDVDDPIGEQLAVYAATLEHITAAVANRLE